MINDPDHGFVENQNEMKVCLLALILILPLAAAVHASDNDSSWSPADNGLRSRMTVDLPKKGNEPFFRVFIELQNVSHVLGEMKIRFDPEKITFKVTSKEGALLAPSTGAYDGFIVNWEPIVLPLDGTIKFPIECQGLAVFQSTKAVIDLDAPRVWVIPQDGKPYFLSATLTIPENAPEQSAIRNWHGTLHLGPAQIPKPN